MKWRLFVVAVAAAASCCGVGAGDAGDVDLGDGRAWRRLDQLEDKLAGAIETISKLEGEKTQLVARMAKLDVEKTQLATRVAALEATCQAPPASAAPPSTVRDPRISTLADDEPPPPSRRRRRRTTTEGPASDDDIPGVPITADEIVGDDGLITKTLTIGGTTEIVGDMVIRGRLYVSDTQVLVRTARTSATRDLGVRVTGTNDTLSKRALAA